MVARRLQGGHVRNDRYIYLLRPQSVPRLDRAAALADLPALTDTPRYLVRRPAAGEPPQ